MEDRSAPFRWIAGRLGNQGAIDLEIWYYYEYVYGDAKIPLPTTKQYIVGKFCARTEQVPQTLRRLTKWAGSVPAGAGRD